MVFDRGSKADFDRWAALGNTGWDYDGLLPYFKKVRKTLLVFHYVFCLRWTDQI